MTAIFLPVIGLNVRLIFKMTSNQTEEIGRTQLEVIRGELQGSLAQAETVTVQMEVESEQLLKSGASREDLREFFYKRKREQKELTSGVCFNVYIAGKGYEIIPDFAIPPEYHGEERIWYKGAAENSTKIFITEPYIDAMSGVMCYTMSKMLPDKETVVALDFNFNEIQQSIMKMSAEGGREALIVTKNGMIIGYNDMSLVGEKISKKLPEYEPILNRNSRGNFIILSD